MRQLIFLFLLFSAPYEDVLSQSLDFKKRRVLKVAKEDSDTIVWKLKLNGSGEVVRLKQEFFEQIDGVEYSVIEKYKKGKIWEIERFKLVPYKYKAKGNSTSTTFKNLQDGQQIVYNQEGQLRFVEHYSRGKLKSFYTEVRYYPKGGVKLIVDIKNGYFWNIIEYRNPAGDLYDFGDFKEGIGWINWLDDQGVSCGDCRCFYNFNVKKKIQNCGKGPLEQ